MRLGATVIAFAALLAIPAAAQATVIDLANAPGEIRVDGEDVNNNAGASVAEAGDVNGDGAPDFIVGAPAANNSQLDSGSAYVVFGGPHLADLDLAKLGTGGFRIDGALQGDDAGLSVAAAGDVNGDGLDDVIVGEPGAASQGRSSAGAAFVVYGRNAVDAGNVDLARIGARRSDGFRIDGAAAGDQAGKAVAGAGDVNGDGLDDVIVGAPTAAEHGRLGSGSAYLVYGRPTARSTDLDLANLTTTAASRGLRIDGAAGDTAGSAVDGAGDFNGDGVDDVVVGAPNAGARGREFAGSAFVVYGQRRRDPDDVDLAKRGARPASRVLRIDGARPGDGVGVSVTDGGDLNGDGRPDVVIGAPLASNRSRQNSGSAYVVYGGSAADPADLDLLDLRRAEASRGMRIDGAGTGDAAGFSVAAGGDLNGDGRPDLILGAPLTANNGRTNSGSAYVVFGRAAADPADLDLGKVPTKLTSRGLRIDGAVTDDFAGFSVAGGEDLDGDGRADAIIGAPDASNNARPASGSAFVLGLDAEAGRR
jgi:hypothetical protein